MAIATDFTVAVNGDIRHSANSNHYTVLELHRFLQGLADDAVASGNDLVDITSVTPSERSTDNIITLLGSFNIDDDAAEYFYAGSIKQGSGVTEVLYSGLKVLGAVNATATQLQIIQNNALYDGASPFWGNQGIGGYNGDAASGILFRCLVKTRMYGRDIDGKKARVQARHWGDTYDFFNVTLGEGESVAAIGTTPDAQNTTSQATVTAYAHVTNTEGYQTIDLDNGSGAKPYYSQWTFGADTSADGLKGIWEFIKDLTGNTTVKTIHGVNGELFLGITHSYTHAGTAGTFTEDEIITWGTDITYDALAGGAFSVGDFVLFKRAGVLINAGKVLYDNGATLMRVALESLTVALADDDTIHESVSGTVTAAINVTIVNGTKAGGEGLLLADDAANNKQHIQLLTGSAPVDTLPILGRSSATAATISGAVTARTIPKIFLGSYTGTVIGAYGIGIKPSDLTASDSVQDLNGATQIPPNTVTFVVSGVVSGQDYILVGPKDVGNAFELDQLLLASALATASETAIVVSSAIPDDTPAAGSIRVELDSGIYRRVDYTSWTGSTFTTVGIDWTLSANAASGNNVMISYIDKLADDTSVSFTTIYDASRSLYVRVRDGGATPIKTFESPATLGSAGGSAVASRITDA